MQGNKKCTTLLELSQKVQEQYSACIVAARVDSEVYGLHGMVENTENIDFLDIHTSEGYQIYQRSLCFLMIKAAHDLYPEAPMIIKHSLGKGIYCEWGLGRKLSQDDISQLEARMRGLVQANLPFVPQLMDKSEAIHLFKAQKAQDKVFMLRNYNHKSVEVYSLAGFYNYFTGCLVPSTGYLEQFGLSLYSPGLLLHTPVIQGGKPEVQIEYKKISSVLREADNWGKCLDSQYVCDLNNHIQNGKINEIMWVAEALQEKRIAEIADLITAQRNNLRLVLIAGPSSSGKTTFAKRLIIQLRVNGLKPVSISLDDYFVSRELTPKDEKGEYDFESIHALDLPLFNRHLQELLQGEIVQLPRYSFQKGARENGDMLQVGVDQPIIIEGIHGLNEQLTTAIERSNKFKIYISALTRIGLDYHNIITTTDTRKIRRIVRDHQYRNYRAEQTIQIWESVRRGEERNIFPYQEEADIMFNSALLYEWCVLRKLAEPLLKEIKPESNAYPEAQRLLHLLNYFEPLDGERIPRNSILREFIGGSYLP
jgi:uridine kinase